LISKSCTVRAHPGAWHIHLEGKPVANVVTETSKKMAVHQPILPHVPHAVRHLTPKIERVASKTKLKMMRETPAPLGRHLLCCTFTPSHLSTFVTSHIRTITLCTFALSLFSDLPYFCTCSLALAGIVGMLSRG
jgi:hypothetical protein